MSPVRILLKDFMHGGLWCDPFAGKHSPAQVTNDINPAMKTTYHMDGLEFLREEESQKYDGAFLDWPYSNNQYRTCYKAAGLPINTDVFNAHYQSEVKNELARILKPNGKVISFGWTSSGLGKKRGFSKIFILIICHGRMHNDTICTVEMKSEYDRNYYKVPRDQR